MERSYQKRVRLDSQKMLIQPNSNHVTGLSNTKLDKYTCDACCIRKATRSPCKKLKINCDSQVAISFAASRIEKSKTKHIDIAYHIVREKLEEGLINLEYVPSNQNLADGITKGLKKILHDCYVKQMGLLKWWN